MNHRPLIVIFLGMLCLYAALIPIVGLVSPAERRSDFSQFSPWLTTDPEIDLTSLTLLVDRQPVTSAPTAGALIPVANRGESTGLTPAGAAPRRYSPLPSARPPVWNPIGG